MTGPAAPGSRQPPPSTPRRSGGTAAWWWIAGIAILISLALVVWLVLSDPANPDPTPPPTPDTAATTAPTATSQEPTVGNDDDLWGPYPPLNIDALKDLSEPNFPDQVQTYVLKSESPHFAAPMARYDDSAAGVALSVTLFFSPYEYAKTMADWDNRTYVGGALCGHPSAAPGHTNCIMAGEDQTLQVGTAAPDVTVENVAAFIEGLYDQL